MTEQIKDSLKISEFSEENDIQDGEQNRQNIKRIRNAKWIPINKIIPDPGR